MGDVTMARLAHRDWLARVAELKVELESAPDNLDLANRYWEALSGQFGFDVRDGKRVIGTFRVSALKSDDGLAALIRAFRTLFDDTGEQPRPSLFDPPLDNLLRLAARRHDGKLADDAAWILSFLDRDE